MADTFTLEVVTPERKVVLETVNEAQIPVLGGYIGVLPGHTPLLAEMGIGELSYHVGHRVLSCTAFGGFVEVLADRVIVLADTAERAEEINVDARRGGSGPRAKASGKPKRSEPRLEARGRSLEPRPGAAAGRGQSQRNICCCFRTIGTLARL